MKKFELERKKKGYTFEDLAKKLNVNVSTVHSWESGKKSMRAKTFKKLLDLGFDEGALIDPCGEVLVK